MQVQAQRRGRDDDLRVFHFVPKRSARLDNFLFSLSVSQPLCLCSALSIWLSVCSLAATDSAACPLYSRLSVNPPPSVLSSPFSHRCCNPQSVSKCRRHAPPARRIRDRAGTHAVHAMPEVLPDALRIFFFLARWCPLFVCHSIAFPGAALADRSHKNISATTARPLSVPLSRLFHFPPHQPHTPFPAQHTPL